MNALSRIDGSGGRARPQALSPAFSRGKPDSKLEEARRRATTAAAPPSGSIRTRRSSARTRIQAGARSSAWRARKPISSRGVEIRWSCDPRAHQADETPAEGGAAFSRRPCRFLERNHRSEKSVVAEPSRAAAKRAARTAASNGRSPGCRRLASDGFIRSYCNTIPTPEGGIHEAGFRAALTQGPARPMPNSRQQQGLRHHRRTT